MKLFIGWVETNVPEKSKSAWSPYRKIKDDEVAPSGLHQSRPEDISFETALIGCPNNHRHYYENGLLVHILEVPAFYITALWLTDNTKSDVVIARLPNGSRVLERSMLYSSQDFP